MDHPCHKCGHNVEDGKAFCSQCGAPQIRVAVAEPPASLAPANVPAMVHPGFPLDSSEPVTPAVPALLGGIAWKRALRVCAVAALISVVVMSFRLLTPLLAVLGAGCVAVILYRYRNPLWKADGRSGARIGAVAGLLASGVVAIFSAIALAVLQSGGPVRQQMLDSLQQLASRSNDPQMQATLDLLKQPEGLVAKLALAMVGFIVVSVAAGSIGGALIGAFLGRRKRP